MAKKRRRFALSLRRCRASWAEKPRPSTNGSLRKSVGKCGGRRLGRRNDARKCGEVWGEPFRTAFARLRAAWFSFVSPSVKEKVWGSVGAPRRTPLAPSWSAGSLPKVWGSVGGPLGAVSRDVALVAAIFSQGACSFGTDWGPHVIGVDQPSRTLR